MNLNKFSDVLYRMARASRDVNAVSRGPGAVARRAGRKAAWRTVARGLRKLGV